MNDPMSMNRISFRIWPQSIDDPSKFQNPRPIYPQIVAAAAASKPSRAPHWKQQHKNPRRFYSKKKFPRFAPFAPRNTTSFIIRAKKSGGIASLVSPSPLTPAILPTPKFSPSREGLVDMAKEKWGVDGYGSMKGLIRLRSANTDEDGDGSSEIDVEEHLEVERRIDHDLSRFEMVAGACVLESRVDGQDLIIGRLEEENLILKERLFLIEREIGDLRGRLTVIENQRRAANDDDDDDCFSGDDSVNENDEGGCDLIKG